jgi:hypothetical protein
MLKKHTLIEHYVKRINTFFNNCDYVNELSNWWLLKKNSTPWN